MRIHCGRECLLSTFETLGTLGLGTALNFAMPLYFVIPTCFLVLIILGSKLMEKVRKIGNPAAIQFH